MKFKFADKTLDYFKENIKNVICKDSYGQYLKLGTATFTENKKNKPVLLALYGGTGQGLTDIPTPQLNNTLPKLYEFWQARSNSNSLVPLFVVGHSFDEVFERKIKLLAPCIPDIRMLQYINVHRFFSFKTSITERTNKLMKKYNQLYADKREIEDEKNDFMSAFHNYLSNGKELGAKKYDIIDWEVQAGEGNKRAEKIDFLVVEKSRKWLTVIELKFTDLKDVKLLGSIFQGMDYCNWVEQHKYELAMIYSNQKIHTRHRTRLILINGPKGFPKYFPEIVRSYCAKDKYQEIECYRLVNTILPLAFEPI